MSKKMQVAIAITLILLGIITAEYIFPFNLIFAGPAAWWLGGLTAKYF